MFHDQYPSSIIFFIILIISLFGCNQKSSADGNSDNRELSTNDFGGDSILIKIERDSLQLVESGYSSTSVENGEMIECKNYIVGIDTTIDNKLEVVVGSGTDVVIKLMSLLNGKCVRYFYINSGTTFILKNIPESLYQLKIAYGKSWLSKYENGNCIGRFLRNPIYEIGSDTLDYFNKRTSNSIQIPGYKLSLDVISSGVENSFNSNKITDEEFND